MGKRTYAAFGLATILALGLTAAGAAAQTPWAAPPAPTALSTAPAPPAPPAPPAAPAAEPGGVPATGPGRSAADRLRPSLADARLLAPATAVEESRAEPALSRAASNGPGIALMAAGGALFVAGAIVGGDAGTLLMVGGAGIGAYGIYLYLR